MKIKLMRAEGPNYDCDKPVEVTTFNNASVQLRRWSDTAPEKGGYHKVDFWITDPEIDLDYKGRYDLVHWRVENACLKTHVLGFLKFYAGQSKPAFMSDDDYSRAIAAYSPESREKAMKIYDLLRSKA